MRLKICAMLAVLAFTTNVHAKDMTGRFGVGADTSLGFADNSSGIYSLSNGLRPALSFVYQVSDLYAVQLLLAMHQISSTRDSDESKQSAIGIGARGHMRLISKGDLEVKGLGGLSYVTAGADDFTGMEERDDSVLSLELGVRPEWFLNNWLSLHTQVGLSISILDSDTGGISSGGTFVNIFGAAELLGSAGFTFYF